MAESLQIIDVSVISGRAVTQKSWILNEGLIVQCFVAIRHYFSGSCRMSRSSVCLWSHDAALGLINMINFNEALTETSTVSRLLLLWRAVPSTAV